MNWEIWIDIYTLVCASIAYLCPTLCKPMDCRPPGSTVHGVFQARILEWVAVSYSRVSSQPRDRTCISCISYIGRWILYYRATWTGLHCYVQNR